MLKDFPSLNNQNPITANGRKLIAELVESERGITLIKAQFAGGQAANAGKTPTDGDIQKAALEGADRSVESQCLKDRCGTARTAPSKPVNAKNMPFFARWFDYQTINDIEREAMSEFFAGKPSKTPTVYRLMRNFIVELYWKTPKIYLTAGACRRALRGDVCAIYRLHAFLEHWGVINFYYRPSTVEWKSRESADRRYPSLANRQRENPFVDRPNASLRSVDATQNVRLDSAIAETVIVERLFGLFGQTRPLCFRCQKSVMAIYYQKKNKSDFGEENFANICEMCFEANNFPIFLAKTDFVKKSAANINGESELSLSDKMKVLIAMRENSDLESLLTQLKASLPNIDLKAILSQILNEIAFGENRAFQSNSVRTFNQTNYIENIESKLEFTIRQFTEIFDEIDEKSDEIQIGIPSLESVRANAAAIKSIVSRVESQLDFANRFEALLQSQREDLKTFP